MEVLDVTTRRKKESTSGRVFFFPNVVGCKTSKVKIRLRHERFLYNFVRYFKTPLGSYFSKVFP